MKNEPSKLLTLLISEIEKMEDEQIIIGVLNFLKGVNSGLEDQ